MAKVYPSDYHGNRPSCLDNRQTSRAEFQKVPSGVTVFLQQGHSMQHITLKIEDTQPIDRLRFLGLRLTQVEHRQFTREQKCNLRPYLSCRVSESDARENL